MNEFTSPSPTILRSGEVSSPSSPAAAIPPATIPPAAQTSGSGTSLVPGLTEEQWHEVQTRLKGLQAEGEKYVRENPARAVVYALGAGFLLGLLFRR
jgi:hypothetical protein